MKALRFDETLTMGEVDRPRAGEGEALLGVRMAGVCSTDVQIVRGYMGFSGTLGHELVAEVRSHPDPAWVGRRVAGEINLSCGQCRLCASGLSRHCPTRSVLGILGKDGCFTEELTLPVENLHAVPDSVSDEAACFVEPLAAAFELLEQVHIGPDTQVAVLGDGKLGLLLSMVLLHTGADVTLVGRHPKKLQIARALGARTVPSGATAERRFDVVVEATGSREGLGAAMDLVAPRGTVVLKSTFGGSPEMDTNRVVVEEIRLVGSRCGPFAPAIRALATGRIDPTPIIEATYPLERGVEAMEHAQRKGALKVLLDMRSERSP